MCCVLCVVFYVLCVKCCVSSLCTHYLYLDADQASQPYTAKDSHLLGSLQQRLNPIKRLANNPNAIYIPVAKTIYVLFL